MSQMTLLAKAEKLTVLARYFLEKTERDPDAAIECMDCITSCPACIVPSFPALRYFIADFVAFFFGESKELENSHPDAASFIHLWKREWGTPEEERPILWWLKHLGGN